MQFTNALSMLSSIQQCDEIPLDLCFNHITFTDTQLA